MKTLIILSLLAACLSGCSTTTTNMSDTSSRSVFRPVNTYSIVCRDPETGEMGVAVQSHWFSVGSVVPWAEAGWEWWRRSPSSIRRTARWG